MPVQAPRDLPPFASSAMDGYALRSAGVKQGDELLLVGTSLAGHPFNGRISQGECIRITTGAAVPDQVDTVIIQENCERLADRVRLLSKPEPGQNIRVVGHDVAIGSQIGRTGQCLNGFDIGWLAACGITHISAHPKPKVAIFSTGDELVVPGEPLRSGQIYDANRYALNALLKSLAVEVTDLGILSDKRDVIEAALASAARDNDLILTSGGVSVGDADYVREVVESLGRIELWRLLLKPGKPLAFGNIGNALFLGLPGNPVSTIVTYLLIAQPLLMALAGAEQKPLRTHRARLTDPIQHAAGREEYQRGITEQRDGVIWVRASGDQSSNRLATFRNADCLIRVPKDAGDLASGSNVEILPFFGLVGGLGN